MRDLREWNGIPGEMPRHQGPTLRNVGAAGYLSSELAMVLHSHRPASELELSHERRLCRLGATKKPLTHPNMPRCVINPSGCPAGRIVHELSYEMGRREHEVGNLVYVKLAC